MEQEFDIAVDRNLTINAALSPSRSVLLNTQPLLFGNILSFVSMDIAVLFFAFSSPFFPFLSPLLFLSVLLLQENEQTYIWGFCT